MTPEIFTHSNRFSLESGQALSGFQLAYHTWGTLNERGDNVIWICHALTGNSNVPEWWPNMVGPGLIFDTDNYLVVCANMLGSCYGSTGPLSINPSTQQSYFHDFPQVTTLDMAKSLDILREYLGIKHIELITGGSMGGQQALSWAVLRPGIFSKIIPMATNAFHSPWGIAFNEAQRMAIAADPSWKQSTEKAGTNGMKAARASAMLSYRHYDTFTHTQKEEDINKQDHYKASSYLQHMGKKIEERFNAYSYWVLSKAMDSHHVGRPFGSVEIALKRIQANALIIGLDTDILFPVSEQLFLAQHIQKATFKEVKSLYGHDGFLVETDQIGKLIRDFLVA